MDLEDTEPRTKAYKTKQYYKRITKVPEKSKKSHKRKHSIVTSDAAHVLEKTRNKVYLSNVMQPEPKSILRNQTHPKVIHTDDNISTLYGNIDYHIGVSRRDSVYEK